MGILTWSGFFCLQLAVNCGLAIPVYVDLEKNVALETRMKPGGMGGVWEGVRMGARTKSERRLGFGTLASSCSRNFLRPLG